MRQSPPRDNEVYFFSPFFFPEQISTGKYNTFLAKALAGAGRQLSVCSAHPLYPDWKPKASKLQLPGVSITRGGRWLRFPKNSVLRRALLESWYALHVFWFALRMRRRIARAIVVFPPNLYQVLLNRVLTGQTRTVGIVHDLQIGFGSTMNGHGSLLKQAISLIEGRCLHSCDQLVFLSNRMREFAVATYRLPEEKCHVFYPFVTLDTENDGSRGSLADVLPGGRRHVVYAGALGEKQDPEKLMRFLVKISEARPDVDCHVFSRGHVIDTLQRKYGEDTSAGIRFHDLVAEDDLPELYARSTVQILPQKLGTGDFAFPSKLPNLLVSGVPIFAVTDQEGDVSGILEKYECGAAVHTWQDDVTVPAFEKFLDEVASGKHCSPPESLMMWFDVNRLTDFLLHG